MGCVFGLDGRTSTFFAAPTCNLFWLAQATHSRAVVHFAVARKLWDTFLGLEIACVMVRTSDVIVAAFLASVWPG